MRAACRVIAFAVVSGSITGALVSGQQPPRDQGTARASNARTDGAAIRGEVRATESGAPLRRVQISLRGAGPESPIVLTDDQGRFVFNNIAPGRYTITAAKAGYATLSYGQTRPGETGRDIAVAPRTSFDTANIFLPRAGVIVAQVTDDLGDPVVGLEVIAEQQRYVDGERRFVAVAKGSTDVNGERRLSGLLPGMYYVTAVPSRLAADGGRVLGPTYYPGTEWRSRAAPVEVAIGEEVHVAFPLIAVRLAAVSGMLRTSDGSIGVGLMMRLVNLTPGDSAPGISQRPDGTFSIANVPPGDYAIDVAPSSVAPSATREYASIPMTVSGEDVSVDVRTSRGGEVRGRFQFDADPPSDLRYGALGVSAILMRRAGAAVPQAHSSSSDWSFAVEGITGPVVFRLAAGPAVRDWYLRSVMLNGVDITDTPVDFSGDRTVQNLSVIVSKQKTTVTGAAFDAGDVAVPEYVAVLFSEDRRLWTGHSRYIATGRPDQFGNFTITGLPPGRYLGAAIDYLPIGEERDPELLERLQAGSTPVVLRDGESRILKLQRSTY